MDPPAPFHPTATRKGTVRVGVGVVVVNDTEGMAVYAGIRKGSHGAGSLALPGGHLELYESWQECAEREVEEEMNVKLSDVKFLHVTNDPMPDEKKHYVTIFMMGRTSETPLNAEPQKCEGWQEYKWETLLAMEKDSLFPPLRHLLEDNPPALQSYLKGDVPE